MKLNIVTETSSLLVSDELTNHAWYQVSHAQPSAMLHFPVKLSVFVETLQSTCSLLANYLIIVQGNLPFILVTC